MWANQTSNILAQSNQEIPQYLVLRPRFGLEQPKAQILEHTPRLLRFALEKPVFHILFLSRFLQTFLSKCLQLISKTDSWILDASTETNVLHFLAY